MNVSQERLLELFLEHPLIQTDSRKASPNSIFFALSGPHYNANRFAAQALQDGSSFAVVDDPSVVADDRYLLVDDTLEALQKLAQNYRQRLSIPVIGITGTNGKTSTKNLIRSVLEQGFRVHATQGNLNNHIGVPLSILSAPLDSEILVIEMGANHPGEIAELCEIAQPSCGIVTNVGIAHLEGFISFDHIVETKTALYRSVAQQGGLIWVPDNQERLLQRSEHQRRVVYGLGHDCDFRAQELVGEVFASMKLDSTVIRSQLIGHYNVYNMCAAAAIGTSFGLTLEQIRKGIESFKPDNMRSQWLQTSHYSLVLDAYNANPSSMQAALTSLGALASQGPLFVILGDMLEMGMEASLAHLNIIDQLRQQGICQGVLVGEHFAALQSQALPFQTFKNTDEAMRSSRQWMPPQGAVVLIKGSRGIGLEALIPMFES